MTRPAEIEDVYRLSPVQQAILFYSLYAPATGAYFEQFHFALQDLDPAVFRRAWEEVVRHTPTLRTSFLWGESEEPMQLVHRGVALPVEEHDLRGLAAAEQQRRLQDLLEADRRHGFDLAAPPLLRLRLVRLGEAAYEAIWSYHHLLLDGWSAALILKEVIELYATLRRGGAIIPPRRRPFRDYIGWLRQRDLADAEAYFLRRLAGLTGPTAVAFDHGRDRAASGLEGWSRRELRLPSLTVRALRAAARSGRLTLNTLVQAGWALVLSRYSGERSVVFGVTVSGRPAELAGVESMIGCFINTLPVRVELVSRGEVGPWLVDLQTDQVELRRHEFIPLQQIRRSLGVPGDLPLFESILVFENFDLDAAAGRAKVRRFQRTNFPLAVVVEPNGEDLWLHLTHDSARFDSLDAERLLGSLATALGALATIARGARLCDLALLAPAERQQTTLEWNDTSAGLDGTGCLPSRLTARAVGTPQAEAVRCGGERLSYGELAGRVELVARRLRAIGVGPEVLVGVVVERSPALLVALLGVLAAGGAYLPLDPSYPAERLRWMLADSQASVLVCGRGLAGRLPAGGARTVAVEDLMDDAAGAAPEAIGDESAWGKPEELQPQNLAYVIYTSGSTGKPKGVAIAHGALLNFLESMRRRPGLGAADVLVAVTSPSFDIAALELYLPLLVGARLVLATRQEAADGARLRALLEGSAATVLQATPATWRLLLEAEWRGAPGFRALCGGEALSPVMAAALCGRAESVWNLYGPTETTIWSMVQELSPGADVTIGRPIANTRLALLDRDLEPVPAGVPGELYIGGLGVARGYWDRPELTAERFLPDPSGGAEAGSRAYRTGDLARWRGNGELEWLGRTDHQVKVRGFRIELGEIEAALERCVGVEQAVVLLGGEGESRALIAYVVGEAAREPERLRAALRERLPDVMVPTRIVALPRLPLTPNGKVDRRALPAGGEEQVRTGYVPPQGPIEEVLCGIWSEVLGRARIGRDESFFELGGHSLLAMRVVSRVRTVLEVELPLAELFAAPTLATLARRIEPARRAETRLAAPPLVRSARRQDLPLSFAQERFWFLDRLQPGSSTYNIPAVVRLEGKLHVSALEDAFAEVVRRHEALRTRFPLRNGRPVAAVTDWVPELPCVDLAALPDEWRSEEARRLAAAQTDRPFDLARGPLARAVLLCARPAEHVAVLTVHHSVADGWSMGILIRELAVLYAAHVAGKPWRLAEPCLQYADFAVWQRAWLTGEVLAGELVFWRQALAGAPDLLELPTDRPRPAVARHRGGRRPLEIAPALSSELASYVHRRGATLFMGLLAVFDALLARITGQNDLVVGSPIAGRTRTELEGLIGPFVNTLALRAEGVGDAGFGVLLGQVKRTALAAYAHQDLPFEKLVEELSPRRTQSHAPVFQVLLALQAPAAPFSLPGLRLSPVAIETDTARFDLALDVAESAIGLAGSWSYDRDLLDGATVARLSQRFAALLAAALASPERPIAELPLLTAVEREELAAWNRTNRETSWAGTLVERIGEQVAARPQAIAISFGAESLTYGELGRRSDRLGRHLRSLGIGPEVLIGICLERTPEMVVALLATWKAGGAYVPLDPSYPRQRIATIAADSRLSVLITDHRSAAALPASAAARVMLDEPLPIARAGEPGARSSTGPESLAYVIYTSGSTGRPKGVAVRQGGLLSFLASMAETPGLTAGDRWLAATTISFDIAALELYLPLCVGARIELASRETAMDGRLLARLLAESGATVLQATPATWRQLLAAGWEGEPGLRALCGGEALPRELGRELLARVGSLWNVYGPTETTIWSSILQVTTTEVEAPETVSIGAPIANTILQVLDRQSEPLPVGVIGELHIGGAGLARGYLSSPEQTAARFVPDALSGEPGARFYRTGDLVRRRTDGCLEFIGRVDHQLKVRGYRIEAGEVEAALVDLGGVQQAVVMVRPDGSGESQLVAYVVPRDEVRSGTLRQALRVRLPEYMVPGSIVSLPEFPLTPNGKVDRRALPLPGAERPAGAGEHRAPSTPVEELLVAIWEEVLGREHVGVVESFFDLGGHSLLATRVAARVQEALAVELPLRALFEAPTVEALAREIAACRDRHAVRAVPMPPLLATGRRGRLPLSFAQERLWFLDQLEPGSAAYNLPVALHFSGRLDLRLLAAALAEVVSRHEALRTVVGVESGVAFQRVLSPGPVTLGRVDLLALPTGRARQEARQVVRQEARRPFVLTAGPLLRGSWVEVSGAEGLLLLTLHHIVADGGSLRILVREMLAFYEGKRTGRLPELASPAVQYGDYALWQRGWLTAELLDEQLAYWRRQLAGSPLLTLVSDRARPPVQSFRGAQRLLSWPAETARSLAALARREGVTFYMTLLAAFEVLILRHATQVESLDEVVGVGTPVAGRARRELEELIGLFVNTLVLRTDLVGRPTFREVLRRVRETVLAAHAHQDLPFERLVDALQPERSLSMNPLVQYSFALQEAAPPARLSAVEWRQVAPETGTAKFDLSCLMVPGSQGLIAVFEYAAELFDAATIARLLTHLETLVDGALATPDRVVRELPLLAESERHQVAHEWSGMVLRRAFASVHRRFAEQALRRPEAIALVHEDAAMSYGELARRAGRLARSLRVMGTGAERVIGVCLERGIEMVVATLAVLTSGGVYLPLDPTYPSQRLEFLLADSRAAVLIVGRGWASTTEVPAEVRVLRLEEGSGHLAGDAPDELGEGAAEHDLAYLIYTSGTSGRPKAVMATHGNLASTLAACQDSFAFDEGDMMPHLASFSFDISLFELFAPLLGGGTSVLMGRDVALDMPDLVRRLAGCTRLHMVPALMRRLVEWLRVVAGQSPHLPALRTVFVGGDRVASELLTEIREVFPAAAAVVLYGPTEGTVVCTFQPVHDRVVNGSVLGRPFDGAVVTVADREGRPAPIGAPGEVCIGGPGVTRGYLARPDLTAEKYVPDSLGRAGAGARLYRTGDLARQRPDGRLEFLGRLDQQVKVRGHRIEPAEIEAVLAEDPRIHDAVVVARRDDATAGESRLVGYLVTVPGERPTLADLRRLLAQRLPEHAIPTAFVFLPELPLTVHGKIDRESLPEPGAGGPELAVSTVDPRGPVEEQLAAIWCELLGRQRVGTDENFFELGGDSILCIQMVARARARGIQLTPKQVFRHQTVTELAAVAGTIAPGPTQREDDTGDVPLTPVQHAFLAAEPIDPHHFNQALLLATAPALDAGHLVQAATAVVAQHSALRLRFTRQAIGWRQSHAAAGAVALSFAAIDIAALPASLQAAAIGAAGAELQASLDLAAGPLARCAAFTLGPGQPGRLLLVIHHLAVDGVSWRILLEDLERGCRQAMRGEPVRLPSKTASFKRWAERLNAHARSSEIEGEMAYWREVAARSVPHAVPIEFPDGENRTGTADLVAISLDADETRRLLTDAPTLHRAHIDEVLLAALARSFAAWSGERSLWVDVERHGREEMFEDFDVSRTVGWFTTVSPVCLDLGGVADLQIELARVKDRLRAIPGRGIGYGLLRYLRDASEVAATMRAVPRPQVSFNYLGQLDRVVPEDALFTLATEPTGPTESLRAERRYLIEVGGAIRGGCLHLYWRYGRRLHRRETIERWAEGMLVAIRELLTDATGSYAASDFPLLGLGREELENAFLEVDFEDSAS